MEAKPETGSVDSPSQDGFFKSRTEKLHSFPQVIHLLVDPASEVGDNLSAETGLPLVSLDEDGIKGLDNLLRQPEYAEGFVLEGFPQSQVEAQELDRLLSATPAEEHRVLGWELADAPHQDVLDHYLDSGLLWMVPGADAGDADKDSTKPLLECLSGLPAFE